MTNLWLNSATLFGRSLVHQRVVAISLPAADETVRAVVRAPHGSAATEEQGACTGDFIVGPENQLVAQAASSFLETPSIYNPLVLVGPPGVGKSHLALGLASRWREHNTGRPALVVTAADFARELASAIQLEGSEAFRSRYAAAGLVVLEDLTPLSTKRAAQQALCSLLDTWLSADTQVIVTSKVDPQEIAALQPRLLSRLSAGLVLPLAMPGPSARLELLQRAATTREVRIDASAAKLLADELAGSAPELIAALMDMQLTLRTAGTNGDGVITVDMVRSYLAHHGHAGPNLRGITSLTARYFGLKVTDLTSPSRRRAVVTARAVAMYLARELTGKSLEQVGAHFGGRDHTTVLHSYRATEKRLRTDPDTRRAVSDLRSMLAMS